MNAVQEQYARISGHAVMYVEHAMPAASAIMLLYVI